MQVAARFKGFLGAQLVHPGEDPDIEDAMYHVVLAFDTQTHLDARQTSAERRQGLAAAAPFVQGTPSIKPMSGLGLWFRSAQPNPPRWKVAVVVVITWVIAPLLTRLLRPWLFSDRSKR